MNDYSSNKTREKNQITEEKRCAAFLAGGSLNAPSMMLGSMTIPTTGLSKILLML
jgi:hypothetical protein